MMAKQKKAHVIGAGLAGMIAALKLAMKGNDSPPMKYEGKL
jgi:succinate dehydrogenase/fumarate reductase flavoprotein subunit